MGALGFPKTGGFRYAVDWQLKLSPSDDGTTLRIEVGSIMTNDDALVNKETFKLLVASVTDVVAEGVRIDRFEIDTNDELIATLDTGPLDNYAPLENAPPSDFVLGRAGRDAFPTELIGVALPAEAKSRLSAEGLWPVLNADTGNVPLSQLTSQEMTNIADTVLDTAVRQPDGTDARSDLVALYTHIRDAETEVRPAGSSNRSLLTSSQQIPFQLGGYEPDVELYDIARFAGAAVPFEAVDVQLTRKKALNLRAELADDDGGLVSFGIGGKRKRSGVGGSLPDGMPPLWTVRFANLTQPTDKLRRLVSLKRSSHTNAELIKSSAPYLQLLEACHERLTTRGPATLWTIDRRRPFDGVHAAR